MNEKEFLKEAYKIIKRVAMDIDTELKIRLDAINYVRRYKKYEDMASENDTENTENVLSLED